jgi:hypothetical protein
MWRRVPSALRFVHAAFSATPINSTNLRGSTPDLHGFVAIRVQLSVQAGSQARNCATASSQGPASDSVRIQDSSRIRFMTECSFAAFLRSWRLPARNGPWRDGRPCRRSG